MNETIKKLVINTIKPYIRASVDFNQKRIDLKDGYIRLFDMPNVVHDRLSLVDLNLTKGEAEEIIKTKKLDYLFTKSEHPVRV